jgi:LAS superfamily LD-carboxypeptidase LdcB
MSFIKHKKFSIQNIMAWFCLLILFFVVQQNFVKAETNLEKQKYSNDSISDFILKKGINIISSNIEESLNKYKKDFDIYSDYSLQKYISDDLLLNNKKYSPSDLTQIDSEYIVNRAWRPYLRLPAQIAFEKMAKDFHLYSSQYLYLISAYRSYKDQATLFEWWCSSNRCAKIWASEHQLWLAVDIHLATKNWYNVLWWEYLDRLNQNAHKYWFINTYRKWYNIDGKMPEVWHRRYVWIHLATELFEKDLSFAQYYNTIES